LSGDAAAAPPPVGVALGEVVWEFVAPTQRRANVAPQRRAVPPKWSPPCRSLWAKMSRWIGARTALPRATTASTPTLSSQTKASAPHPGS